MGFSTSAAGAATSATTAATTAPAANPALAQLSVLGGVTGAISSTLSAFYSGAMQKQQLKHSAVMSEINARISEMGAQSALLQGKSEVAKLTAQAGQLKSRQKVSLAANGVDLGVGSAAEVQASTDLMKEIDADTIKANALRTAWGYRTQSMNYRNQADAARATASGISPVGSAFTSLVSGSTQVASSWYGLQREGAFGTSTDTNGNTVNSWW